MSSLYPQKLNFSPARNIPSPHLIRTNSDVESQYLQELLGERQKLGPFMQVLPICSRLLDQEILRVSGKMSDHGFSDYDRLQRDSPSLVSSLDVMPDFGGKILGNWNGNGWSNIQHEFNFVGRLLGPRGNSLKRVEASTGCRVFIRGKGSIKNVNKEESLRGKPGYEHLNEPLHILIEVEATEVAAHLVDVRLKQAKEIIEELLKPVDESQDLYKRQQLRELVMLNNIREESPQPGGIVSPFTFGGIKRPKTSW